MRIGVAVLGLLLVAGEAQAADQFDLVCKGEFRASPLEKTGKPDEERFRINLSSKQWCEADCTAVHPIAEVTPTRISLEIKEDLIDRSSKQQWVDRVTGVWQMRYTRSGRDPTYWLVDGSCQVAPFSGINPATKF